MMQSLILGLDCITKHVIISTAELQQQGAHSMVSRVREYVPEVSIHLQLHTFTYERDINKVIKEFSTGILQAAKECIPKGAIKDYKPYWSDDLENKHKALSDARKIAETNPSVENNMALKHASAKYTKTRNEARTNFWIKKW